MPLVFTASNVFAFLITLIALVTAEYFHIRLMERNEIALDRLRSSRLSTEKSESFMLPSQAF